LKQKKRMTILANFSAALRSTKFGETTALNLCGKHGMSGKVLFDSNSIIDLFKGRVDLELLRSETAEKEQLISIIARMGYRYSKTRLRVLLLGKRGRFQIPCSGRLFV
jgi:hypothetical protein